MKNRSEGQQQIISEEGDNDCTKSDEPVLPLHQQLNSTIHTSRSAPSLFTRVQSFSSFSKFSSRQFLPQAQDVVSYPPQQTHCMQDIETADQDDQSTILSMSNSMNSLSDMNLIKQPMSTVTAEVTESSSDSEDLSQVPPSTVVYHATAPSYTSDVTTTSTAMKVATKRKTTSLMRRNE